MQNIAVSQLKFNLFEPLLPVKWKDWTDWSLKSLSFPNNSLWILITLQHFSGTRQSCRALFLPSIFGFLCAFLLSHSRVVFPWWSHSTASTLTSPWLTPKPLSSLSPNHMSSCLLCSCKSHTGNLKSICSESNSSPPTILSFPRFNTSPSLLHPNSGSHWNLTVLPPLLPPFSLHCNCPHPNESLTTFLLDVFLQFAPSIMYKENGAGMTVLDSNEHPGSPTPEHLVASQCLWRKSKFCFCH